MLSRHMLVVVFVFFFKQKTAYEMRISDWSSDVCSSDLPERQRSGDAASAYGCGEGPRSRLLALLCAICVDQAMAADGHADAFGQGTAPVAGGSRPAGRTLREIGRASCRERVCQ